MAPCRITHFFFDILLQEAISLLAVRRHRWLCQVSSDQMGLSCRCIPFVLLHCRHRFDIWYPWRFLLHNHSRFHPVSIRRRNTYICRFSHIWIISCACLVRQFLTSQSSLCRSCIKCSQYSWNNDNKQAMRQFPKPDILQHSSPYVPEFLLFPETCAVHNCDDSVETFITERLP